MKSTKERLDEIRAWAEHFPASREAPTFNELLAEIDALTHLVDEWRDASDENLKLAGRFEYERDRLAAQVATLREAIQWFIARSDEYRDTHPNDTGRIDGARDLLNRVLAETAPEGVAVSPAADPKEEP